MDDLNYIFDRKLLQLHGKDIIFVKETFQNLFRNKAQNIFDALGGAKFEQLFDVDNVDDFLENTVPKLMGNNSAYRFIKIK